GGEGKRGGREGEGEGGGAEGDEGEEGSHRSEGGRQAAERAEALSTAQSLRSNWPRIFSTGAGWRRSSRFSSTPHAHRRSRHVEANVLEARVRRAHEPPGRRRGARAGTGDDRRPGRAAGGRGQG